jgi:hypothetical protein
VRGALALPVRLATPVDHADRGLLQRNLQSYILRHVRVPPFAQRRPARSRPRLQLEGTPPAITPCQLSRQRLQGWSETQLGYAACRIASTEAARRCWSRRRREAGTGWLSRVRRRQKFRGSSQLRHNRAAEPKPLKPRIHRMRPLMPRWSGAPRAGRAWSGLLSGRSHVHPW